MEPEVRSLRLRLAAIGFVAAYGMVLILLTVVLASDEQVDEVGTVDGTPPSTTEPSVRVDDIEDAGVDPLVVATAILLAPLAAGLSWWWSGRAVRPVERSLRLQRHLIEEASHELRTPLSILTTNAEVVLSDPEATIDTYRLALGRSADVAGRMGRIIESLLVDARSRSRVVDRRPVDLVGLARSATDALAPVAADAGLSIEVVARGPVRAPVDPVTVERAVSNLVANGLRHGPPGTAVVVEVAELEGGRAQISVTDEGPGIAPADQAAVFERYWRRPKAATPPGPSEAGDDDGSGLGLAIVRQVAVAHGGSVEVESPLVEGRGTRLKLVLLT